MITPVVEVDGRDRQVDIYNWHLAHPKDNWPPLVYWGKYLVHDNNRDAMGATLALTKNVIDFFVDQKVQLLHDLHESVPYLYDNTVGDGPYNAWVDPILADEWQLLGWNNMSELTKFGMPGAFAHGQFDTWSPGYLMFIAAMHNGTSRLYETFGNAGADTVERTLRPDDYARTWYRQNPPLPKAMWSQRNNNNYQQTGLLTSLSYYAANNKLFLKNFYLKAKRSVLKAKTEGPAAYVFPADDPRPGLQADAAARAADAAVRDLARHRAVHRDAAREEEAGRSRGDEAAAGQGGAEAGREADRTRGSSRPAPTSSGWTSRTAASPTRCSTTSTWSPNDPQKTPYDDTGWTFGELFNVQVMRVPDPKVLDAPMEPVAAPVRRAVRRGRRGRVFVVNHDTTRVSSRCVTACKDVAFEAAEEPFEAAGRKFNRGVVPHQGRPAADIQKAAADLGLQAYASDRRAVGQDPRRQGAPHRLRPHAGSARRTRAGGGSRSTA